MILKGLAVDEEAVSVIEMEGTAVQISGRLRGGWAGPRSVVGLSGWHSRWSRLGSEDEMLRYAQHDNRGKRAWGRRRVFVRGLKLEMGRKEEKADSSLRSE